MDALYKMVTETENYKVILILISNEFIQSFFNEKGWWVIEQIIRVIEEYKWQANSWYLLLYFTKIIHSLCSNAILMDLLWSSRWSFPRILYPRKYASLKR